MMKGVRMLAAAGLLSLLLLPGSQALRAQAVSAVPTPDLDRFVGNWYELARYPNKREKHCLGQPTDLVADGSRVDQLQLVSSCLVKDGSVTVRNATIKKGDKSGDGKLKVIYLWPFSTKYWVMGVGPDYTWALLGSPNHKQLWIFSRTPAVKAEVQAEIVAKAVAEGFGSQKLILTHKAGQ